MNDLNSVFLVGRLTADPESKKSRTGGGVLKLRIANNHYSFNEEKKEYEEETGFFNIVVFGRPAEKLPSSLAKGTRIGVNGRLVMRSFKGKDGADRTACEIVGYSVQILDPANRPPVPRAG
jgi:single-strand DNA-binding protein